MIFRIACAEQVFGLALKMPVRMPTSYISVSEFEPQFYFQFQIPENV